MNDTKAFLRYVWGLRKPYLWIILISLPLQFIILKLQYPYPNFRQDSASYIAAAYLHASATEWPVGYSLFLRFIHWFSHSDTLLVCIQYLLLELSALFFLFSLKYFTHPGKIVFNILFVFILFNPIFLHLGNYIMSDCLFISLSLLWITQLIWIICRPSPLQIVSHALLLLCLFSVRYNALFYPLVSVLVFILSAQRIRIKVAGIMLSFIVIIAFIGYIESAFDQLNGIRQFSPFGGWQLANNALYMYSNIQLTDSDNVPARLQPLDSLVRQSFITARRQHVVLNPYIKDYYIWHGSSPLLYYLKYKWKGDTTTGMFKKWASMGPLYSAYGDYLVRKYPVSYFKYFVYPNMGNFFFPLTADLGYYNRGTDRLDYIAAKWFDYPQLRMIPAPRNYELTVIQPYPTLMALSNIIFLVSMMAYLLMNEFKSAGVAFNRMVLAMGLFWILNFFFSSSASSIEIRYQVFQFILNVNFSLLLIKLLLNISFGPSLKTVNNAQHPISPDNIGGGL